MNAKEWEKKETEINKIIEEIDALIEEIDALLQEDEFFTLSPQISVEA